MPVGAIIGGVASVGGALLSSSSQKKAADQASDTAAATAAQNNALQERIYGQNAAALSPFQQRGNSAGDAINSLLGLGTAPQQQATQFQQQPRSFTTEDLFGGNIRSYNPTNQRPGSIVTPQAQAQPQQGAQQDYNDAFQNYQNSTGYQFRVDEGVRALDASAVGAGVRNSGAAAKALTQYGQNIGSQEFGNYLGYLGNQQGVGLSAASAQAGVGQNFANSVSANNNAASTVAANAALSKGQANADLYGNIGNAVGSLFGSSFG